MKLLKCSHSRVSACLFLFLLLLYTLSLFFSCSAIALPPFVTCVKIHRFLADPQCNYLSSLVCSPKIPTFLLSLSLSLYLYYFTIKIKNARDVLLFCRTKKTKTLFIITPSQSLFFLFFCIIIIIHLPKHSSMLNLSLNSRFRIAHSTSYTHASTHARTLTSLIEWDFVNPWRNRALAFYLFLLISGECCLF